MPKLVDILQSPELKQRFGHYESAPLWPKYITRLDDHYGLSGMRPTYIGASKVIPFMENLTAEEQQRLVNRVPYVKEVTKGYTPYQTRLSDIRNEIDYAPILKRLQTSSAPISPEEEKYLRAVQRNLKRENIYHNLGLVQYTQQNKGEVYKDEGNYFASIRNNRELYIPEAEKGFDNPEVLSRGIGDNPLGYGHHWINPKIFEGTVAPDGRNWRVKRQIIGVIDPYMVKNFARRLPKDSLKYEPLAKDTVYIYNEIEKGIKRIKEANAPRAQPVASRGLSSEEILAKRQREFDEALRRERLRGESSVANLERSLKVQHAIDMENQRKAYDAQLQEKNQAYTDAKKENDNFKRRIDDLTNYISKQTKDYQFKENVWKARLGDQQALMQARDEAHKAESQRLAADIGNIRLELRKRDISLAETEAKRKEEEDRRTQEAAILKGQIRRRILLSHSATMSPLRFGPALAGNTSTQARVLTTGGRYVAPLYKMGASGRLQFTGSEEEAVADPFMPFLTANNRNGQRVRRKGANS